MNDLPEHRKAINGRTFGRHWRPEHYAPIERRPPSSWWQLADFSMAIVIGVLIAIALVSWWAS